MASNITQGMEELELRDAKETCSRIEAASVALAQAKTRLTHDLVVQSKRATGQFYQLLDFASQLTILSTAPHSRDRTIFPFFALPAEIRNRIVEFILVPGEIRPRLMERTLFNQVAKENWKIRTEMCLLDWKYRFQYRRHQLAKHYTRPAVSAIKHKVLKQEKPLVTHPAIQLLATCQQVYHQYHTWLYSRNSFLLDPGPIQYAARYFNNLQPHHHAMIKTVIITFTLADLTPLAFTAIDKSIRRLFGKNFHPTFTASDRADVWADQSRSQLIRIWTHKIVWAYEYQTLRQVEFRMDELSLVLSHEEVPRELGLGDQTGLLALLAEAVRRAERRLDEKFASLEVAEVKRWLAGGAR